MLPAIHTRSPVQRSAMDLRGCAGARPQMFSRIPAAKEHVTMTVSTRGPRRSVKSDACATFRECREWNVEMIDLPMRPVIWSRRIGSDKLTPSFCVPELRCPSGGTLGVDARECLHVLCSQLGHKRINLRSGVSAGATEFS